MRRAVGTAIGTVALTLLFSGSAQAASYSDPTGDTCKDYGFAVFCGFDITGASDARAADGTVHLSVTYANADCVGNGFASPVLPRFAIFDSSQTAPPNGRLGNVEPQGPPPNSYQFQPASAAGAIPVESSTTTVGAATTTEVILPKSLADTLGSFKWLVGNACIGEQPEQASDIAPNSGLFAVGSATPPSATPPCAAHSTTPQKIKRGKVIFTIKAGSMPCEAKLTKVFLNIGNKSFLFVKQLPPPQTIAANGTWKPSLTLSGDVEKKAAKAIKAGKDVSAVGKFVLNGGNVNSTVQLK